MYWSYIHRRRGVCAYDNRITFGEAQQFNYYGNVESIFSTTSIMVPLYIYGIKGVL